LLRSRRSAFKGRGFGVQPQAACGNWAWSPWLVCNVAAKAEVNVKSVAPVTISEIQSCHRSSVGRYARAWPIALVVVPTVYWQEARQSAAFKAMQRPWVVLVTTRHRLNSPHSSRIGRRRYTCRRTPANDDQPCAITWQSGRRGGCTFAAKCQPAVRHPNQM
jgi:hypothetical protein